MTDSNAPWTDAQHYVGLYFQFLPPLQMPVTKAAHQAWCKEQIMNKDLDHPDTKRLLQHWGFDSETPDLPIDRALYSTNAATTSPEERRNRQGKEDEIIKKAKNLCVALWNDDAAAITTARNVLEQLIAETFLVDSERAKKATNSIIDGFDRYISKGRGKDVSHLPPVEPIDWAKLESADTELDEHLLFEKYRSEMLSQLTFPVSKETYATFLKMINAKLAYERAQVDKRPEVIADLEKQAKHPEPEAKLKLNFDQLFALYTWADNQRAKQELYEQIVVRGERPTHSDVLIHMRMRDPSYRSPMEAEEDKRLGEILEATLKLHARGLDNQNPDDPDKEELPTETPPNARVEEYKLHANDDAHTEAWHNFLAALCSLNDVFWDEMLDQQEKWVQSSVQEKTANLAKSMHDPASPVNFAEGEWQASTIATRYADIIQKAREKALGEKPNAGCYYDYNSGNDEKDSGWGFNL
jgi:hypothetical protein